MATDLQTKPGQPKHEAFVDAQLARVRTRIRALDTGRSLMLLGVVTLGYFLAMAVFDLAVGGADDALYTGIRLAAFGAFVTGMLLLLARLAMSLYWRINPYYAAKRLEEQLPDAKNSLINWLDLKNRELPGAIRNAVGQRAARELKQADPEKAVNPGGNWLLGGILAVMVVGLLILFALGPNQFGSLWRRAFAPFLGTAIGNRAEITLIKPAGGNVTVPLGQRVEFQVQIEGRFPRGNHPGAPRVLYRYQQADAYVPLPLEENNDGTWGAVMLGDQVQGGFWYKVAAGDKETSEYQIKVQSLPQAVKFEVAYHHRPYRKLGDSRVVFPNEQAVLPFVKEYRGTQVKLTVRTNRELRGARIDIDANGAKRSVPAEILREDPKALHVQWTLEQRGTFRVSFTSKEGEENIDRSPYLVEVLDDLAPRVVLTLPGKDGSLPLGSTLKLEGAAQDDIGIKSMVLRLKVLEGDIKPDLRAKIYRDGKSFRFDDGTYPDALDYKDFLVFDTLATAKGEPLNVKPGMVFEYWLEATDNSDYPNKNGNVGKSQTYKLLIEDRPKDGEKQKQDQKKAQDEQHKHEQKQDQDNEKENQKRNDGSGKGKDDQNQQDQGKNDQGDGGQGKNGQNKDNQNKDNQAGNNEDGNNQSKDNQTKDNQGGKNQSGDNQKDKSDETKKNEELRNNVEKKANELRKQFDKDDAQKNSAKDQQPKGSDGTGSDKGKEKDDANKNGKSADQGSDKDNAKDKDSGGNDAQAKEQGAKDKGGQKDTDAKGDSNDKGDAKAGADAKDGSKEDGKTGGKDKAAGKDKGGQTAKADGGKADGLPEQLPQPKSEGETEPAKGNANTKPGDETPTNAKESPSDKGSGRKRDDKEGNPKTAKSVGTAKNDQPPKQDAHDATSAHVRDLKDTLQKKNDKDAREALERIAKEAKDQNVRDAAKDALDKFGAAGKDQNSDKQSTDGAGQAKSKEGDDKDGPKQDGIAQGAKKGENKADGRPGDGVNPKESKNNTAPQAKSSNSGPGAAEFEDDLPGKEADAGFAKRSGELQLEDLRKRMTPETLKKLGWSDQDWQKFLNDAEAYNALQHREQAANKGLNKKGGPSQIPNWTNRQGDRKNDGTIDPLVTDRAPPPPEFRDAQQRFTTSPPGKR